MHRSFNYQRKKLLRKRQEIQAEINSGKQISYPEAHHEKDWKVAPVPHDLQMRHVEITGPTDCKMVINALNSGADMYMADFEDSLTPSWKNIVEGQINLLNANRGTIRFINADGRFECIFTYPPRVTGFLFFLIVLTLNQKVTKKVEMITIFHSTWPVERPTTMHLNHFYNHYCCLN